MTAINQPSRTSGPVALKNVAMFMAMAQRVIDRDSLLPGIAVCSGPSGYGKTFASIFAQNKTGAIRVEVGDTWTKKTFLQNVLKELGEPRELRRASIAELSEKAIIGLGNEPQRPLIVDEADKCVDKNFIETVRELHEHSGVPVILIGEERLPNKLLNVERVHNRVLHWMQAQPCDLDDVRTLAKAFAPTIAIADDLLEAIRSRSVGRARRVVVNVANVAEFCRNKGLKQIDAVRYGGGFYTGEPPAARAVQAFPRKAA